MPETFVTVMRKRKRIADRQRGENKQILILFPIFILKCICVYLYVLMSSL